MAELLAVLYRKILRSEPGNRGRSGPRPFHPQQGACCAGAYAVLAECGFFPLDWLESFYQNGARLAGHVTARGIPGVEVSTGALGHGLAHRLRPGPGRPARRAALPGLRPAQRRRVRRGLDLGGRRCLPAITGLENLVAVVDYNKIQSLGRCKDVLDLDPFAAKWSSFGWAVREIDGHDVGGHRGGPGHGAARGRKAHLRDRPHRQGQRGQLHGRPALWHYRTPARRRIPAGDRGNRGGAMRTAFIKTITEMAAARSPRHAGGGRPGVRRRHRLRPTLPQPVSQRRRGRAEHDGRGRRHGPGRHASSSPTRSATSPRSAAWSKSATTSAITRPTWWSTAVGGGFAYGALGMSHHATEDLAILRGPAGDHGHCPRRPAGGRGRRPRRGGRHRSRLSPPGPGRRNQRPPGTALLDARQGHHPPRRRRT